MLLSTARPSTSDQESFAIDGLDPGRYVVSGWPVAVHDSSLHPMTVVVRDGESEVTIELWAAKE